MPHESQGVIVTSIQRLGAYPMRLSTREALWMPFKTMIVCILVWSFYILLNFYVVLLLWGISFAKYSTNCFFFLQLCTLEFETRRASYYWLLHVLELYQPYVWEYSRLNISNAVMSKRKVVNIFICSRSV